MLEKSGNSVWIKLFGAIADADWKQSSLKPPFAQIAMLRWSVPTVASSPHLPNPLLPMVVITQEFKKADSSTAGALHPAETQFLTSLPAIILFLQDRQAKTTLFIAIFY